MAEMKMEMRLTLVQALNAMAFNWDDCVAADVVNALRGNDRTQVSAGRGYSEKNALLKEVQKEIQNFLFESERVTSLLRQNLSELEPYEPFVIDIFYTE